MPLLVLFHHEIDIWFHAFSFGFWNHYPYIKDVLGQYKVNLTGYGFLIRTRQLPAWSAEEYRAKLLL